MEIQNENFWKRIYEKLKTSDLEIEEAYLEQVILYGHNFTQSPSPEFERLCHYRLDIIDEILSIERKLNKGFR